MIVSITRLHLRSSRFLLPFIWYSLRSARQARKSPGNVQTHVHRDAHGGYWTRSVWQDEGSMRTFMMSGVHRCVMPKLLDWCDEGAVVHWEQDGPALPDWNEAHRRLTTQGRPSKLRHPSPSQAALDYPRPQAS